MTSDFKLRKRATGIPGLDDITQGGLPAAGVTLIAGNAGTGKTILGLQILANAAASDTGAVFVSFEESKPQIQRDAASFQWGNNLLATKNCSLIDARPPDDIRAAGDFDLEGTIAIIQNQTENVGAGWVVLDGIDYLLRWHPNKAVATDQIRVLNNWCLENHISLLLTAKRVDNQESLPFQFDGIEFMLDTIISLKTVLHNNRLNRRFRIEKYRGSRHVTDELPLIIDDAGFQLPYGSHMEASKAPPATTERFSTGIEQLDSILGGGFLRGSSALISGQPGTSKTSLAAHIAEAAAERGEQVLYLSFDELADRIVRNVASVGIDLNPHLQSGRLRIYSRDSWRALVEEHYIEISRLLHEFQPHLLVIDPISALMKVASTEGSEIACERIMNVARELGVSAIMTSLTMSDDPHSEATISHVSTLADTWISLGYAIRAGERNRSLSIVKSRGTAHSNQVRELLLSDDGIDLAEVYQFGSEVLMGTARVQKEAEEATASRRHSTERQQRQQELRRELEQAQQRLQTAESEAKRIEEQLQVEEQAQATYESESSQQYEQIRRQRNPDRKRSGLKRPNDDNGDGAL